MTRRAWVHPIADLPCLKADWHLSLGVGHNEHLLHHRCGGRDHSSRRFSGPASIRKSCKPWPPAVPPGHDTRARHRAFGFWIAGATLIVAKPGGMRIGRGVELCNHTINCPQSTELVRHYSAAALIFQFEVRSSLNIPHPNEPVGDAEPSLQDRIFLKQPDDLLAFG